MKDYLTLESSPTSEPCVQVSSTEDYYSAMCDECCRYAHMLRLRFPQGNFGVKTFYHDFGTYREVVIWFDDEKEWDLEYVNFVESNLPEKWTDIKVLLIENLKS